MDADRLADTLTEALVELRQTRQLLNQTATLLCAAWQLADLEGHAWGPPLPEQGLAVADLPTRLGTAIMGRLTAAQAGPADTRPADGRPAVPAVPGQDGAAVPVES